MTTYISELAVSLNKAEERSLRGTGFTQIVANLNKGECAQQTFLWYKMGPIAITRIQASFNGDMAAGLVDAGYKKINNAINTEAGGNKIYLWSYQGTGEYDTPIIDISVTTVPHNEAEKFASGWQRLACDLNRGAGGDWIHIWVKREKQTFICDITATDSYGTDSNLFEDGYLRVDEDTNRGAGGLSVFIWYRQTTDPKRAITDLQVAVGDNEAKALEMQHFKRVKPNLNRGTNGENVYLFYKKVGSGRPIMSIALLANKSLVTDYQNAGLRVIETSLNSGNDGPEFLCLFQFVSQ